MQALWYLGYFTPNKIIPVSQPTKKHVDPPGFDFSDQLAMVIGNLDSFRDYICVRHQSIVHTSLERKK